MTSFIVSYRSDRGFHHYDGPRDKIRRINANLVLKNVTIFFFSPLLIIKAEVHILQSAPQNGAHQSVLTRRWLLLCSFQSAGASVYLSSTNGAEISRSPRFIDKKNNNKPRSEHRDNLTVTAVRHPQRVTPRQNIPPGLLRWDSKRRITVHMKTLLNFFFSSPSVLFLYFFSLCCTEPGGAVRKLCANVAEELFSSISDSQRIKWQQPLKENRYHYFCGRHPSPPPHTPLGSLAVSSILIPAHSRSLSLSLSLRLIPHRCPPPALPS